MLDMERLERRLMELDALRDSDSIQSDSTDRIEPQYADGWPAQLSLKVRQTAEKAGIERLYRHQYEAIEKSLSGKDVAMESPTASGKTLAFTLPMLHALKENPNAHALMIYPMKALAFDQREQIRELCDPLGIESFPYDGDTDPEHRQLLRRNPPSILLTNPEYLNMSFLAYKEQWEPFLRRLKYVVIDEMHMYRGFFGCNMALLLRRFFCHLSRIGASPRVVLSTATCANPEEHAMNLIGREVDLVSARDVFRPKRHFMFIKPDLPDFRYRDLLRLRIINAALSVLKEDLQTLVFCPTKKFLEQAFRDCKSRAKDMGLDADRVVAFHADMKSDHKQEIQQQIKAGQVSVVFSSNALELGIDIGGLDGVILAGFPASVMSTWQQIGRAGRGWDKDAFVLLYAMNDPIDQFFAGNLNAFLTKDFDQLVIDPSNEEIIQTHVSSLIDEIGGRDKLRISDMSKLGEAFFEAARTLGGEPPKSKRYRPQIQLKLRGIMGKSYALKRGNEEIGQISDMRRFREAYIGAVFIFLGQNYIVHSHEANAVALIEAENQRHRTDPMFFTQLFDANLFEGRRYALSTNSEERSFEAYYGSLNIAMNFRGYSLINEAADEVIDTVMDPTSLNLYNHHAFSIILPEEKDSINGVGALEHMIRVGAMFVIPVDRFDASAYSRASESDPTAYYYENHPGGIGIAKKLVHEWPAALQKGIEIAENCDCRSGCQNCIVPPKSYNISNADIDKNKGIELARELLAAAKNGPTHEFKNGMMQPVRGG